MRALLLCLMVLGAAALPTPPALAETPAGGVWVLAVASPRSYDTGLPDLRYAKTDLARFAAAMQEIGQVPPAQIVRLEGPSVGAFRAALRRLKSQRAGKLLFYYSGHADANGLHLADGLLRREELHELLTAVKADTRVAFLDSCYSGALAAKGVKPAAEFNLPKAEYDEPSGSVFLAATGAADAAFEIDELRGSLFTHYLVSGLYGQADGNRDGLVTVEELYQFVYREVSLHNVILPAATQKPEYRVDLHGRGALVVGFPKQVTTPVTLGATLQGEVTFAADNGLRLYRLQKAAGEPQQLALFPGAYTVIVKDAQLVGRGALLVKSGTAAAVDKRDLTFEETGAALLVAKGKGAGAVYGLHAGVHLGLKHYSDAGGPYVNLDAATPAARLHVVDVRLHALPGFRRHQLKDGNLANEAELLAGASAAYFLPASGFAFEGQQLHLFLGGGASRINAPHDATAGDGNVLKPEIQKIGFALGTSVPARLGRGGMLWSLEFRREFLFATAEGTGDVLALAGNLVGLALHF